VNEENHAAILAEIIELAGVPERQPTDISIKDLAEEMNVTDATVVHRMKPLVEAGKFKTMIVYDALAGRNCRIYRKA